MSQWQSFHRHFSFLALRVVPTLTASIGAAPAQAVPTPQEMGTILPLSSSDSPSRPLVPFSYLTSVHLLLAPCPPSPLASFLFFQLVKLFAVWGVFAHLLFPLPGMFFGRASSFSPSRAVTPPHRGFPYPNRESLPSQNLGPSIFILSFSPVSLPH